MRTSSSLAWILASALVLGAGASSADPQGGKVHQYVGHTQCKTCHSKVGIGDQYNTWKKGPHAKAFESLASDKAKEWAAEKGISDPQTAEECVKCHVTAYGAPEELLRPSFVRTAKDGVQCESCHGAGRDYRRKRVMMDRDRSVAAGLVIPDEALCIDCHNDQSPAWDPERYTTKDGRKVGFDFEQASEEIAHAVPEGYDPMADDDD